MKPDFHIYAGADALAHIRSHGLQGDDISMLLGASSGPKWLVLHGFDQYLLTQFAKRRQPLHLLGTSAGAWRMSCYARHDGLGAHRRLTEAYVEQCYSARPSGQEILDSCENIIAGLLGEQGADEIINHDFARYHLITTQCHGLAARQNRLLQGMAFLGAALGNLVSRQSLNGQFTRVVMHHPAAKPPLVDSSDLRSREYPLSVEKMQDSILSTGCIPVLINGVRDVAGKGVYQDGGITDYGFDLPFVPDEGFVLYPHFAKQPAPGWFDKNLKWRKPSKENYRRTIMLVPTDEFVASLPYGKIPDRKDFEKLDDESRIKYWREVIQRSQLFSQQLVELDWAKHAEPLPW